jgi:Protein of unknown function (DUF2905)
MGTFGKVMMAAGVAVFALGLLVYLHPAIPWLGRLPGDFRVERPGFRLFLPVTTCLVVSAVLSLLFYLFSKFR